MRIVIALGGNTPLAEDLSVDVFVMATDVDGVCLDRGTERRHAGGARRRRFQPLSRRVVEELR